MDYLSDTWTAVDGLGRSVATNEQVGGPRKDRFVGMFYFLWLGEHGKNGPYDIAKILKADPDAMQKPDSPLWGPMYNYHHWSEPLFGYYLSSDRWVYRKHAQMLADAGVDVVIFDASNGFTYPESYTALCETWSEMRKEGNATPQIAFLCPFFNAWREARVLYDDLYAKNRFSELWFRWKGKPLLLANKSSVEPELQNYFTFRRVQPSYFDGPATPDTWGWLEVYPQHVYKNSEGEAEQMPVGIGQNGKDPRRCAAFSEPGTHGRSWHDGKSDIYPGSEALGLNFAEQWARARTVDPQFVFVTGWNEWVALRLPEFNGLKMPVMFVDQYTPECSRDIEPMQGGFGDAYYYQLVDEIRQYKGVRPIPIAGPMKTIHLDGKFADWDTVSPEYRDTIGDTAHRNSQGWGNVGRYINTTGRNDIVRARVARDKKYLYFFVETHAPISPSTDVNWMTLLINTHRAGEPNWEGYNFVVNRVVKNATTSLLERNTGGWSWRAVGNVHYRVTGTQLELAIPRASLGFTSRKKPIMFDFKWVDNMQHPGDIMEFTVDGDAAPNGRFTYRFTEK